MFMDRVRRLKAEFFQALAHPNRLAIIDVLREGELPVGVLCLRLGLEQANVSQHLAILKSRGLLDSRRDGNQVLYSVRDPLLFEVLDTVKRYAVAHLEEDLVMLREMKPESAS